MSAFSHAAAGRRLREATLGMSNRRIADHWLTLWNGDALPAWSSFDAALVADLAPGLAAFEFHPDERLICILCGDAVRTAAGVDLTGKDWVALAAPEQRDIRLNGYRSVTRGAVLHSMRHAQHRLGGVHYVEEILLPFAPLPNGVRPVLAHIGWRPLDPDAKISEFRNSFAVPDDITLISLAP